MMRKEKIAEAKRDVEINRDIVHSTMQDYMDAVDELNDAMLNATDDPEPVPEQEDILRGLFPAYNEENEFMKSMRTLAERIIKRAVEEMKK